MNKKEATTPCISDRERPCYTQYIPPVDVFTAAIPLVHHPCWPWPFEAGERERENPCTHSDNKLIHTCKYMCIKSTDRVYRSQCKWIHSHVCVSANSAAHKKSYVVLVIIITHLTLHHESWIISLSLYLSWSHLVRVAPLDQRVLNLLNMIKALGTHRDAQCGEAQWYISKVPLVLHLSYIASQLMEDAQHGGQLPWYIGYGDAHASQPARCHQASINNLSQYGNVNVTAR